MSFLVPPISVHESSSSPTRVIDHIYIASTTVRIDITVPNGRIYLCILHLCTMQHHGPCVQVAPPHPLIRDGWGGREGDEDRVHKYVTQGNILSASFFLRPRLHLSATMGSVLLSVVFSAGSYVCVYDNLSLSLSISLSLCLTLHLLSLPLLYSLSCFTLTVSCYLLLSLLLSFPFLPSLLFRLFYPMQIEAEPE